MSDLGESTDSSIISSLVNGCCSGGNIGGGGGGCGCCDDDGGGLVGSGAMVASDSNLICLLSANVGLVDERLRVLFGDICFGSATADSCSFSLSFSFSLSTCAVAINSFLVSLLVWNIISCCCSSLLLILDDVVSSLCAGDSSVCGLSLVVGIDCENGLCLVIDSTSSFILLSIRHSIIDFGSVFIIGGLKMLLLVVVDSDDSVDMVDEVDNDDGDVDEVTSAEVHVSVLMPIEFLLVEHFPNLIVVVVVVDIAAVLSSDKVELILNRRLDILSPQIGSKCLSFQGSSLFFSFSASDFSLT